MRDGRSGSGWAEWGGVSRGRAERVIHQFQSGPGVINALPGRREGPFVSSPFALRVSWKPAI
ncbi:hypothetical protein E2C01_082038 [Portunus trituberculatus]|uniref:Uncharacterized protein n=1 Tax=Portunus trituberculatus TaxID=210409 RepID=A0A5B7J3W7_PORTR|nr:hypothetical protein [Portunus trituberculatus]